MRREEIEKLLGGYATGTLSEAEQRVLFEAALEDQELFDALAKEQALRDVLADPPSRQQLIAALGPEHEPLGVRAWRWLRQPAVLAMAGGAAMLAIVAGLLWRPAPVARPAAIMAEAMATKQRVPIPPPARMFQPLLVEREIQKSLPLPAPPQLTDKDVIVDGNLSALRQAAPLPPRPIDRGLVVVPPAAAPPSVGQPGPAEPSTAMHLVAGAAPSASLKRAKASAMMLSHPSMKYTLLLRSADGIYSPALPDAVFHAGDSVRVQAEASETGYSYLFQKSASGTWDLAASLPVEKGQRYALPPDGGIESDAPAHRELLLVFSRHPQATGQARDFDALASNPSGEAIVKILVEFR